MNRSPLLALRVSLCGLYFQRGVLRLVLTSCHSLLSDLRLRCAGGADCRSGASRVGTDCRMPSRLLGLLPHRARRASHLQPLEDARLARPVGLRANADLDGDRRVAPTNFGTRLSKPQRFEGFAFAETGAGDGNALTTNSDFGAGAGWSFSSARGRRFLSNSSSVKPANFSDMPASVRL